jgi:hypothetical protein
VARAALLYTTNNDIADSWPVVIDYVRDNGVLHGETFLGIPARFMPTRMRVNAGLLTAATCSTSATTGARTPRRASAST